MVFITQFSNNSLASKGFKKLLTVINLIIENKFCDVLFDSNEINN